ncbi:DUF6056 family protein [Lachnoclostridium sp. Marseille-P6806]|uniref:DUF6056 family protein n=1 Tax=Lachnoclostridium sp. Marseille-P6806 TaxID=2364793 RepID=UPI00103240CB|nr:DUF6056 family protein [Lachnoclostridium sp. Marseille-P6806]
MKRSFLSVFSMILLIVLAVSLIPVIYASRFAYPWADDFSYSAEVRAVFLESGSPFPAIAQAFRTMAETYRSWQGTYTSCFLMALQPAVWGIRLYHLTGVFMLGSILISYYVLFDSVFVRLFRAERAAALALYAITAIASLQTVQSQSETYTWYNSAVHYTFMHALWILYLALVIRDVFVDAVREKQRKGASARLKQIGICLLGFLAAGGNNLSVFNGVLTLLLFIALALFYAAVYVKGERRREVLAALMRMAPAALSFFVGAAVNFGAPGNAVRKDVMRNEGETVLDTVRYSFVQGWKNLGLWFNGYVLAFIVISSLVLLHVFRERKRRRPDDFFASFRYPLPLLAAFTSFCLFCAYNAPAIYTSGAGVHIKRLDNVMIFLYLLLILCNLFYGIGWLSVHAGRGLDMLSGKAVQGTVLAVGLGVSFWMCRAALSQNPTVYLTDSALYGLKHQTCQYYGYQMAVNTAILESDAANVQVYHLNVDPALLYPEEAEDWIRGTKLFYQKESVEYYEEGMTPVS